MNSWVIVLGALFVLAAIRLATYQAFGAAWAGRHLAGRRVGIVLAVIAGIAPLAVGICLFVLSGDKLPGALLVAAWMLGYLPLALLLSEYAEGYGVQSPADRPRSSETRIGRSSPRA